MVKKHPGTPSHKLGWCEAGADLLSLAEMSAPFPQGKRNRWSGQGCPLRSGPSSTLEDGHGPESALPGSVRPGTGDAECTMRRTRKRSEPPAGNGLMRFYSTLSLSLSLTLLPQLLFGQAIEGHLVEAGTGEPIVLAQVTLLTGSGEIADQTFTDEAGYFIVASDDPGSFFLRAERMGFSTSVDGIFELGEGGVLSVEFRLRRAPMALDTLVVEAERRDLKLDLLGFYDRRRAGFGRFIGPEEIERTPVMETTDLLRMIPRVRINHAPFGQSTVTIAGSTSARGRGCYPKVILDGFEVSRGSDEPARLDELISPVNVRAIEVYRGATETPLQFGGASSPCGVILIWTR